MYSVPVISPFDLNDDLNAVYRGESALLTHVLRLASLQDNAAIACLNLRVQHHRQAIIDNLEMLVEIVKQEAQQTDESESHMRFSLNFVVHRKDARYQNLLHFYQLHYLSDNDYIAATRALHEVYSLISAQCEALQITLLLRQVASLKEQIERQKVKGIQQEIEDAIKLDNVQKVTERLSERHYNVNMHFQYHNFGEPSLIPLICIAAKYGSENVVRYLIQQGADVKAKDSANKMNALTKACVLYDDADFKRVKKRISIATLLIEHGVDINQFVNTSTQSALDNATLFKFEEMKQLLLEKGAKYRTLSVARPFFTFFSSYQLQGGVNATDVSVASYH